MAHAPAVLFLNKLLPVFVLPIGLLIILVAIGTVKQWRWLVWTALVGFYALCTPLVGGWLIGWLEAKHPRLRVAEAPTADVVLVLGGTMGPPAPEGYLPNWHDSMERFEGGVALVQAGRGGRLLFTGAVRSGDPAVDSEGEAMRRLAIARGVPSAVIDVTGPVGNTADEVRELKKYCGERGVRRVLLVTSAWHMPRAMRQFRKTGLEITAFPVDFRSAPDRPMPAMDFLPHAQMGLGQTETALRECLGIAFYTVTGP